MLLGLLMASAMPEAFGHKSVLFAVLGGASGRQKRLHDARVRAAPSRARSKLPSHQHLAVGIRSLLGRRRVRCRGASPVAVGTRDVTGEHMAERVSLFIIIALRESIIVAGTTFSRLDIDWVTAAAFSAAFASTVLRTGLHQPSRRKRLDRADRVHLRSRRRVDTLFSRECVLRQSNRRTVVAQPFRGHPGARSDLFGTRFAAITYYILDRERSARRCSHRRRVGAEAPRTSPRG